MSGNWGGLVVQIVQIKMGLEETGKQADLQSGSDQFNATGIQFPVAGCESKREGFYRAGKYSNHDQ